MLSSLTNSLFEKLVFDRNDLVYKNYDIVKHGFKTKSLMVTVFKQTLRKLSLLTNHSYLLTDMNKDSVKLYNPHGKIILVPKQTFFGSVEYIYISYFDNKVFNMPEKINISEFTESWSVDTQFECEPLIYINYELFVEEENTEMLVNLLGSFILDIKLYALFFDSEGKISFPYEAWVTTNDSLRFRCDRGVYVLHFRLYNNNYNADRFNDILQHLNAEENKVFIRFASSNQYMVRQKKQ